MALGSCMRRIGEYRAIVGEILGVGGGVHENRTVPASMSIAIRFTP